MKAAARYQGVEKHSSGFKLLAAMGWKEGEGLGAKRQGMKEHVKVRRMQDKVGIGLAQATKKSRDWTIGMAAYDQVLAKLGTVGASGPQAGTKKRKQSEAEAAEGAAEVPKRRKKTKSSSAQEEPSQEAAAVSAAGAGVQTEALASAAAADGKELPSTSSAKAAEALSRSSHLARFGRRRAGKNVRSYSGSDLAAILGGGSGPAAAVVSEEAPAASAPTAPIEEAATDAAIDDQRSRAQEAASLQEAGGAKQRWWHSHFVPAGRLGSKAADCQQTRPANAAAVKVKVAGFSEDDQAALYNLTQSSKTAGKQGLGVGKGPRKVAGARWQGTKTRLGEGSDAEQEAEAAEAAVEHQQAGTEGAGSEGSEDTHVSSHGTDEAADQMDLQSSRHPAAAPGEGKTTGAAQLQDQQRGRAVGSAGLPVKGSLLRRLAESLLTAAGGQLRVKKLEKRVLDAAGLPRGGHERREARKHLRSALQKKPRFGVLGDEVVLVS